jgi:2-polyprenyl-3-methyl-5-hydroxy-6-metoxy-1,4-benzoquinol methylase
MALLAGLRTRNRIPELMDDPSIDPGEHRHALMALASINRVSNSAGILWPVIPVLARKLRRPVRILDVATGSGDVLSRLLARARRAGVALDGAGCDISPTAIDEARRAHPEIEFFVHDAIGARLPNGFDIVISSLFLHHLSHDYAIALLANMEKAACHLVLVNDLARSRFNYLGVWLATRLLTRSRVVRFDGPASVRSAFTPVEVLALAERAGLSGAVVLRKFPARFLLTWERK